MELIPLALLAISLALVFSNYSALPDMIPSHFNIMGVPDAWEGKNSILMLPAVSAFIYILFTAINVLIAVIKDPRKVINTPPGWKANLNQAQIEELRVSVNRFLFALKSIILGMFSYMLYQTIEVAHGRASSLGSVFNILLAVIFLVAGWMIVRLYQITHRKDGMNIQR